MGLQKNKIFYLEQIIKEHQLKSVCMVGKQDVLMNWQTLDQIITDWNFSYDRDVYEEMKGKEIIDSYLLFRLFGATKVSAVDYSDYEGADILADLNKENAISEDNRGQFDLVVDGGTLEHIYDQRNAMENMNALVKEGDTFFTQYPVPDGWIMGTTVIHRLFLLTFTA